MSLSLSAKLSVAGVLHTSVARATARLVCSRPPIISTLTMSHVICNAIASEVEARHAPVLIL